MRPADLLHVDAVQAAGRIACDIGALGADLLTLSAHKIGGAKGVGALVRASEDIHLADPLIRGGGQERGLRAGTENVAGHRGFWRGGGSGTARVGGRGRPHAGAAGFARSRPAGDFTACGNFGAGAERLPNTTLFALAGHEGGDRRYRVRPRRRCGLVGRRLLVGQGAAVPRPCRHGGFAVLRRGAVRVSLGWTTTEAEIERFQNAWRKLITALSKDERGKAA
jgi:cysteine desulfurase